MKGLAAGKRGKRNQGRFAGGGSNRRDCWYGQKECAAAKQMHRKARQLYLAFGNQAKADEIAGRLDQIDADAAIMATLPE